MKTSKFSDSQIMAILKQAEAGTPAPALCREHGISSATFYKWRSRFGGMNTSMMARLKELETENARLKNDVCRRTAQSRNTQRGHRKKVVKPTGVGAKGGEGKNYPCASRVCSVWHQRDLLSLSGEAQR